MAAGLALALGSALGTNVAFLFKQPWCGAGPPVHGRHPLHSAVGLFRSRWFSLGWAAAAAAWGFTPARLRSRRCRISMHGRVGPAAEGLLLGVAAGVLLGVSDIALKYLTEALRGRSRVLTD